MTQIPILSGIYSDAAANFRVAYPVNLEPIVTDTGLSKGFLRSAPGIVTVASGQAEDRGAIVWNGIQYRVMGGYLVSVVGAVVSIIGTVGGSGPVTMTYSFDNLAIASGGAMFYYNGSSLNAVTDPNLGTVLDVIWIDGYFMTTDGTFLIVTDLTDPYAVDPLHYGSSEADPDPIVGLKTVRGQVYALNRYTIENFQNQGGAGFPFQRNTGGMIPKGCVGTHAADYFLETFAFVGGGRNEGTSVYLAGPGQAVSISTPEIDRILADLSDAQLAAIEVESREAIGEKRLLIHLPDRTLVYYREASEANGAAVWSVLASGLLADQAYPGKHFVLSGGLWYCGSPAGQVGYLSETVETQFDEIAAWRFDTGLLYNAGNGLILRSLELVAATGRAPLGANPTCSMSITQDGATFSQQWFLAQGTFGERNKRLQWRPKVRLSNFGSVRFQGANTALASFGRLEGDLEALNG